MLQVTTPLLSDAGSAFAPTTSAQAASCSSVLGRNCVVNYLFVVITVGMSYC